MGFSFKWTWFMKWTHTRSYTDIGARIICEGRKEWPIRMDAKIEERNTFILIERRFGEGNWTTTTAKNRIYACVLFNASEIDMRQRVRKRERGRDRGRERDYLMCFLRKDGHKSYGRQNVCVPMDSTTKQ